MRKMHKIVGALFAVVAASSGSVAADLIAYDNTLTPSPESYFHTTGTEFGDEVNLALPSGWYPLTSFGFEYRAEGLSGGETAVVRIYANDGAATGRALAPGTLLFDSSVAGLTLNILNGSKSLTINGNGTTWQVPTDFTWTVSFNGVTGAEKAGLLEYDPPTVGTSYNDYWQKDGSTWSLYQIDNGNIPANFGARVVVVPEPSVIQLGLLAGAGWLSLLAMRRRS